MKQKLQQNKRAVAFFFNLTLLSLVASHFNHELVLGLQYQVMLWLGMLLAKYLKKKNFTLRIGGVEYEFYLERGLGIIILVDLLLIIGVFLACFNN